MENKNSLYLDTQRKHVYHNFLTKNDSENQKNSQNKSTWLFLNNFLFQTKKANVHISEQIS